MAHGHSRNYTTLTDATAKPVMFSTNGYTKPALEEASALGVKCIDGLRLSQMATQQTINWL